MPSLNGIYQFYNALFTELVYFHKTFLTRQALSGCKNTIYPLLAMHYPYLYAILAVQMLGKMLGRINTAVLASSTAK